MRVISFSGRQQGSSQLIQPAFLVPSERSLFMQLEQVIGESVRTCFIYFASVNLLLDQSDFG